MHTRTLMPAPIPTQAYVTDTGRRKERSRGDGGVEL
jgi:hypothetical protein